MRDISSASNEGTYFGQLTIYGVVGQLVSSEIPCQPGPSAFVWLKRGMILRKSEIGVEEKGRSRISEANSYLMSLCQVFVLA